ncbi:hypothetical protein LSH36_543g06015 [Paralvinella palmiformis]|uniref:Uncharacterized protein n=1 Tax=Paralvinella palmiformis TaxID=53620 RepID=A0AAD9J7P3_9ANNE|nr:hypothetical protein LSH36_543g06015 [Paralvinella palmiformis]
MIYSYYTVLGQPRCQWESGEICSESEEKPKVASYMIDPRYDGYLLLLQERNKIVKKLQTKNPKQIELERKEQGFSLYLNGANTKVKKGESSRTRLNQVKPRKTKTSAGSRKEYLTPEEFDDVEAEEIRSKLRANTAPTKGHRKNWNAGSVDIKTHRGEKVKVRAPGK